MGLQQSTVGKGGSSSRFYELNLFHWCDNLQVSSHQMCPSSVASELVVLDILCFGGRIDYQGTSISRALPKNNPNSLISSIY
ncbi:hypothetical protein QL285_052136 [Trifolium repens]|nr:hypothetical protein QL285_052136 [Trifolium repens]